MATEYFDMLDAVKKYYGEGSDQWVKIASGNYTSQEFFTILQQTPNVNILYNGNNEVISYSVNTVQSADMINGVGNLPNSNVSTPSYSSTTSTSLAVPANTTLNESGKVIARSGGFNGAVQAGMNFISGEVLPAIAATSVGISLGRVIDKTLYNANPEFWDSKGMSALNPDTWSSITVGDDSLNAKLFNMVFGIKPNEGTTQPYIDQMAYAYLAKYMYDNYIFAEEGTKKIAKLPISDYLHYPEFGDGINVNAVFCNYVCTQQLAAGFCRLTYTYEFNIPTGSKSFLVLFYNTNYLPSSNYYWNFWVLSTIPISSYVRTTVTKNMDKDSPETTNKAELNLNMVSRSTLNGTTFYYSAITMYTPGTTSNPRNLEYLSVQGVETSIDIRTTPNSTQVIQDIATVIFDGYIYEEAALEGVSTQEFLDTTTGETKKAKTPDTSKWENANVDEVLESLKEQYPEVFQKSITKSVVQPDGTTKEIVYVPIPWPEGESATDIQPVTSTSTLNQEKTAISEATLTDGISATLLPTITGEVPVLPPDTGSGDTPTPIIPTVNTNAMWAIYNPTPSQLSDFGHWLWSPNFVDQLLKMFNNPMESIISLHKIFAVPVTSGSSTIIVGYLSSGVSALQVSSQYITVDCGSVDLREYYGNVFDYTHTEVQIYLPFIGIVPLSTSDVMRSTITVTYHIDVYTGACLAEIHVKRDNAGGILYTFSGNCAVQYPLSSGNYMGIFGSFLTAGAMAAQGYAAGAISAAGSARAHTFRSGDFNSNAGAMGVKKPYLIISRVQSAMSENYSSIVGNPSNALTRLGNCSGHVRVKEVRTNIPNALAKEIEEIESLLKSGIEI